MKITSEVKDKFPQEVEDALKAKFPEAKSIVVQSVGKHEVVASVDGAARKVTYKE